MNQPKPVKVTKRDGSIEPFQNQKLRRCFAIGLRACAYEEELAGSLTRAVEMHLREWENARPPSTNYLFRCVRDVLMEVGLSDVAQYLIRHRRRRMARRKQLWVYDPSQAQRELVAWRKGLIVRALERSCQVRPHAARILAGEIERRVLDLDYDVVTTTLVAELVRSELLAWGLADEASVVADERDLAVNTVQRRPEDEL